MPNPFVAYPSAGSVSAVRPGEAAAAPADANAGPGLASAGTSVSVPSAPELAPIAGHLADPAVTDLFINGAAGLWCDRGDGAVRDPLWSADEATVRDLAVALIGLGGRHLDEASPAVDVRLEGGMRVHAVLPPVSTGGTTLSVRIPRVRRPTLDDLVARGTFEDPRAADWLKSIVSARVNVLVTGGAGSGKTTLLAAMLSAAPPTERIVTIEDVAELTIAHPHHIALEARQANLEGAGGIGLARLVREALRMRPDRLVLGECRGEEVRELLAALNTGHDGGAGTVHASRIAEVPARLEALGALAGLNDAALARQAVGAIHFVLHTERDARGTRRLTGAGVLRLDGGRLEVSECAPWA
ncbi:TadA family conjugal transfer-associated ATPase [Microbacterium limosum]|uniref:TadA family conjugal transfer-associated ATPase n=1 Tax=Microbacterium limosum TaxID=3079935 RepID=A0AAU0MJ13_9MICO|nr:TadA family conjugal transfer-associated ATPase [Microbacterium sp. Y20]WOQ70246.1 TadA family conjugal transfer-associated ATPase [Microbacterium sp. Y20]